DSSPTRCGCTSSSSSFPSGVKRSDRPSTRSSAPPNFCSRVRTCCQTVVMDKPCALAAAVKFPCNAARQKLRSWGIWMSLKRCKASPSVARICFSPFTATAANGERKKQELPELLDFSEIRLLENFFWDADDSHTGYSVWQGKEANACTPICRS